MDVKASKLCLKKKSTKKRCLCKMLHRKLFSSKSAARALITMHLETVWIPTLQPVAVVSAFIYEWLHCDTIRLQTTRVAPLLRDLFSGCGRFRSHRSVSTIRKISLFSIVTPSNHYIVKKCVLLSSGEMWSICVASTCIPLCKHISKPSQHVVLHLPSLSKERQENTSHALHRKKDDTLTKPRTRSSYSQTMPRI